MIPKYAMVKIKSIKIYIKKLIEDIERKGDWMIFLSKIPLFKQNYKKYTSILLILFAF